MCGKSAIASNPLHLLLTSYVNDLRHAEELVGKVFKENTSESFAKAMTAFGHFFGMYMRVVRVSHLAFQDSAYRNASQERVHNEWAPAHKAFHESLEKELYRSSLAGLRSEVEAIGWDVRYLDVPFEPPPADIVLANLSDGDFRACAMDLEGVVTRYLRSPATEQGRYYVDSHGDAMALFAEAHKRGFLEDREYQGLGRNPTMMQVAQWLAVVSQNVARKTGAVLSPEQRATRSAPHT